jgi:glycosyltransferase involved in cell wall biosynthesis
MLMERHDMLMERREFGVGNDAHALDACQPGCERFAALREHERTHPEVSVVIPAINEADSIGWVLERIPGWVSEVVLVDGLSIDQTEQVARQLRPDLVVVHQRSPGKGSALRAGFAAAQGEHIVMLDADGSLDPAEMPRFIDALEEGADFVKGSRYLSEGGSADLTRLRSAGNRALARLANLLYGARFTDLCYGYCAFRRCHLEALALTATGFEIETQLVLNAVSSGLEVREVPSFEHPRRAGVSNLHAYRDGRRVLKTLLTHRRLRADAQRAGASIDLLPLHVSSQRAHSDRPGPRYERRRSERRGLGRAGFEYAGPERRRGQRRGNSDRRELVYMATGG